MSDIDLAKAIEAVEMLDWSQLEFGEMPHIEEILETALPHILAQVEARVKPSREQMIRVLKYEFGSFLAHTPHNPGRFWGLPADAVLALLPGKTEQEVRRAAYDDLIAELLSVTEDYVSIAALSGIVGGLLARGGEGR